ncbi:MAG: DNA topoisomerase IV subunit A [Tenericutes bacterium]|nr:DNA topoisomerase IV subunit A [Mycoplasmatota bacterium]
MQKIISKIEDYSLEYMMEKSFARYSKSIIQDRALPDVRDGLKPVQRRILYGMYIEGHTYDKPPVKSARSVGDIMGKFHPHGDSSIYDAMVRMSQWWKQNECYIDMQGNNGSMDGDGAAAMRYTEARLSKISNELMKDIKRGTVDFVPNFDDSRKEPLVLPAKYPNLLVNGAVGISAGYATNIPPHNLGEVIDATIKRIDSPSCYLETIMDIVKGPDFPTGGIVEGKKGIYDAFKTGRGKIVVKSKYEVIEEKNKKSIIISQIPFDINKLALVSKMCEIKIDKKIDGIIDIRDESDRQDPVRIVIEIKKDADPTFIMNYFYKNTDLMINYNYNMVAIVNKRPVTIGILGILDAYISHLREVIVRRTKFDLEFNKNELHIVEGLIKALSILDEVIRVIRSSKDKTDAINNLVKEFDFTFKQAEAIVVLQLYRLTNTDVTELEEKAKNLKVVIAALEAILSDENRLKSVMKEELKEIKKNYATERKTEIRDEVEEIKIDTVSMIPKEDVVVIITKEGYVKRVSLRSYDKDSETIVKDGDYVIGRYKISTLDTILIFTNKGNYLYVPVFELPDLKWKELGKHISNIITLSSDEMIVAAFPVYHFEDDLYITIFTKNGMAKRTKLNEFVVQRYSKPISSIKLKDNDEVVSVDMSNDPFTFIVTKSGYALTYKTDEIPVVGVKAGGVKAITLKNDEVISGILYNEHSEYLTIITDKKTAKRVKLQEFELTSRARRGVQVVREVKTNPYAIMKAFIIHYKEMLFVKTASEVIEMKLTEIPIADRVSTGSSIAKTKILDVYPKIDLREEIKEEKHEKENISLEEIDKKMMTIDDFLDNLE